MCTPPTIVKNRSEPFPGGSFGGKVEQSAAQSAAQSGNQLHVTESKRIILTILIGSFQISISALRSSQHVRWAQAPWPPLLAPANRPNPSDQCNSPSLSYIPRTTSQLRRSLEAKAVSCQRRRMIEKELANFEIIIDSKSVIDSKSESL